MLAQEDKQETLEGLFPLQSVSLAVLLEWVTLHISVSILVLVCYTYKKEEKRENACDILNNKITYIKHCRRPSLTLATLSVQISVHRF